MLLLAAEECSSLNRGVLWVGKSWNYWNYCEVEVREEPVAG